MHMPGLSASALDGMTADQARQILLDVAKIDGATLSYIGATPENEPVWVVDTHTEVGAGSQDAALKAYALSNFLEIIGPVEVRNEPGSPEASWEVYMSVADSPKTPMLSARTQMEALEQMRASLQDMAGSCVLAISDWADLQAAGSLEEGDSVPKAQPKAKLSPFVTMARTPLSALPLSAKLAKIGSDLSQRKIRRKLAFSQMAEPQGMGHHLVQTESTGWNLPVLIDESVRLANHHDLIAALRLGLNTEDIAPWPNDVAHRFLVHQELRSAMRSRGYAELTDFDASKHVHLRASLLEFSPEITGDKAPAVEKPLKQEKPVWPPQQMTDVRVVLAMGRARLAYEEEPEWEQISIRNVLECCGFFWVEVDGPSIAPKKKKPKNMGMKTC
jgi:hypothetical protein